MSLVLKRNVSAEIFLVTRKVPQGDNFRVVTNPLKRDTCLFDLGLLYRHVSVV